MMYLKQIGKNEAQTSYFQDAREFFRNNSSENCIKVILRNNESVITRFETEVYDSFLNEESRYWYALFKISEKESEDDPIKSAYRYVTSIYQIDFLNIFEVVDFKIEEIPVNVINVYKNIYRACLELPFADSKNVQNIYLLIKFMELDCEKKNNPKKLSSFYDLVYKAKEYRKN